MKLVTQDYGCGTSSSILDYGIEDVVVVSEGNYEHVFLIEDDLLFIGHDFLLFLWDNEEKLKRWQSRRDKWEHWVWCFERVDAIVSHWQSKSHYSLNLLSTFCKRFLACDEDDCDKYGFDWLPQWASCNFHSKKGIAPVTNAALFSGQAAKPEYAVRTALLREVVEDTDLTEDLKITNLSRDLCWDTYVDNLLMHSRVLNPVGVLKALNTRAYESIYSGRLLLQQTVGEYKRHRALLAETESVAFFENFEQLKKLLVETRSFQITGGNFEQHSLYVRMRSIGVDIK